jgi:hypothetical protein
MSTPTLTRAAPWQAGLQSARALFRPGLVLQAAALGLVLSYYYLPAAHDWFGQLAHWRMEGGFVFSALASALCGGLLPFLYLRFSATDRSVYPWPHAIFFTAFWAWKGAEVDLMYRTLAHFYGTGTNAGIIIRKVIVDQFGYNLFYAAPIAVFLFAWKDAGFNWSPVLAEVRSGRWYARRVLPVLIGVWALWIPVVSCVYALPPALQIPLFNIVLCFWSLLFAHITARQSQSKKPDASVGMA